MVTTTAKRRTARTPPPIRSGGSMVDRGCCPAAGWSVSAGGTLTAEPHFGHLSRRPVIRSGSLRRVWQEGHARVAVMVVPFRFSFSFWRGVVCYCQPRNQSPIPLDANRETVRVRRRCGLHQGPGRRLTVMAIIFQTVPSDRQRAHAARAHTIRCRKPPNAPKFRRR